MCNAVRSFKPHISRDCICLEHCRHTQGGGHCRHIGKRGLQALCGASPPSPLGLAIAAAILASTRPAGPCCCNPCCANSVSLQRAMRADECQLHTVCRDRKQPGAVQSATAGPRPSRRSLDTLRALHPPPMHPSPPPRNAERKDCKARRCAVRRIAGLLSCAHTLAHYD